MSLSEKWRPGSTMSILNKIDNPKINSIREQVKSLVEQLTPVINELRSLESSKLPEEELKLKRTRLFTEGFKIRESLKEKVQEAISILNAIGEDETIISQLLAKIDDFNKAMEHDREDAKEFNITIGGRKRKTRRHRSRRHKKTRKH